MDYSTKSDTDLLQILEGARGRLAEDASNPHARKVFDAAQDEAIRRGFVNPRTKARIKVWTAADVEDLLFEFIELTKTVRGNTRLQDKGFTGAGGKKKRGEMAIDAYTAIKVGSVDAEFVAYAPKKGDVPHFILFERLSPDDAKRTETGRFSVQALLADALPRWRELTRRAGGKG